MFDTKKRRVMKWSVLAISCTLFSACAPLVAIKKVRPHPPKMIASESASAMTAVLADARRYEHRDPKRAIADYLEVSQLATAQLRKSGSPLTTKSVRAEYNFAVSRVLSLLYRTKQPIENGALVFTNGARRYSLRLNATPQFAQRLKTARWIPTDEMVIRGSAFPQRTTVDGVGAPIIALFPKTKHRPRVFDLANDYGNFTAVIDGKGERLTLAFYDPSRNVSTLLDGRRWPLAADYSAKLAEDLVRERPEKIAVLRMFRPATYDNTTRLYLLQRYDPRRTPVVLVHGLQDTPANWTKMVNSLQADAAIRRRFQFWLFSYPSGYPFTYSAMLFEQCLNIAAREFPTHRKFILIGHSMGGLVVRLQVTNTGYALWQTTFRKEPWQLTVSERSREMLRDSLIFKARTDTSNVIFISTPHLGSTFAVNWIGRIGSALVRLPMSFIELGASLQDALVPGSGGRLASMPNSIDTLSPNYPALKALDKLPVAVPFDSIIGRNSLRGPLAKSTDGIVPYWSSHLAGARSETVILSRHTAQLNPLAIRRVKTILLSGK